MNSMTLKVCHVTSVHSADDDRIFHKECVSLSKKYNVVLVAPNTPSCIKDGVEIVGVQEPAGRIGRILRTKKLYPVLIQIDADVYHFHDPELILLGYQLKKRGKKIIFDSHEDVPNQILCKEWIPNYLRGIISHLYSLYEKWMLRKYDALVSVTPSIVERLAKINPHTYQITNYPIYTELSDTRKWGRSLCFAGGVNQQYMHHIIVDCIEETNATYELAGKAYPSYLEDLKRKSGWKRVNYHGLLPYSKIFEFIQRSSVGLAILDYTPNVGYKRGTIGVVKLFEYMMAGIPVIATDFILWKEIIDLNKCGICVNPNNKEEIVDAINYCMNHLEECKRMGDNGKKAVRDLYNWASQEIILYEMYDEVLRE